MMKVIVWYVVSDTHNFSDHHNKSDYFLFGQNWHNVYLQSIIMEFAW